MGIQIDNASRDGHEAILFSESERYSMLDKEDCCCCSVGKGIDSMTLEVKTRCCKLIRFPWGKVNESQAMVSN